MGSDNVRRGVPRRALLLGGGAVVGGGVLARTLSGNRANAQAPSGGEGDLSDWAVVRRQFELDPDHLHFAAMLLASHPRRVAEAIGRHRDGLQRNPARYVLDNDSTLRLRAVEKAASFFGAQAQNVALTDSTTMGLSLLYNGLKLSEGDEVVVEDEAYYSTVEALRYQRRRSGVVTREVSLYDDPAKASAAEMVDRLMAAVGPRTRVMALTWVHSDTGVKLPIAEISRRVAVLNRSRSATERVLVCVDGVHGFGVEAVTLGELGCDFFVAGTHKWMFGPRGTGVLYAARTDLWDRVIPTIPAFGIQSTPGLIMSPGGFHAFEHRWAMAEAFSFVRDIGLARISRYVRALSDQLKAGLSGLQGVSLLTPRAAEASAAIVAFNVDGMDPQDVADRLLAKKIIVAPSTWGAASVRATPSVLNTAAEVDRLIQGVADLA